jgi:serine protease Do
MSMIKVQRIHSKRLFVATALVLVVVATAGLWISPAGLLTAQSTSSPKASPAQAVGHANALSEAFRYSAEQVMPAVVSITNEAQPRVARREQRAPRGGKGTVPRELPREYGDLDPLLRRFFEQMPDAGELFELPQMPRQSSGSGVIIDPSGVILTNNHVVAGDGKVTVRLSDGREYRAEEVLTDPATDIAVVRIKTSGSLPVAKLGNSDELKIGDWVLAVGQPFQLINTLTAGIVSATGRAVGITKYDEFIQTDAAINPGNSGGPLVNLKGEVVGINTAISSSSGGFQGVGFSIPANVAKWVSSQLLKDGKVRRSYVGIGIQQVDQELAEQLGMALPGGALVTDVQPESPAAAAGIKPQDVIIEFGGTTITNVRQLQAITARSAVGSKLPVVVLRDGKRTELTVTAREQPANYGERTTQPVRAEGEREQAGQFDALGLQVAPLTSAVAQQLGLRETTGVVITAVEEGSLAQQAGLEPSMAIVQVARKPVQSVADYEAAVRGASVEKGVLLLVRSGEGSRFVVLKKE